MVMNAVKDVAAALGDLINSTKLASGKPIHDPAMNDLKESAKVCFMFYFEPFTLCFTTLYEKQTKQIFCLATNLFKIYRFLFC